MVLKKRSVKYKEEIIHLLHWERTSYWQAAFKNVSCNICYYYGSINPALGPLYMSLFALLENVDLGICFVTVTGSSLESTGSRPANLADSLRIIFDRTVTNWWKRCKSRRQKMMHAGIMRISVAITLLLYCGLSLYFLHSSISYIVSVSVLSMRAYYTKCVQVGRFVRHWNTYVGEKRVGCTGCSSRQRTGWTCDDSYDSNVTISYRHVVKHKASTLSFGSEENINCFCEKWRHHMGCYLDNALFWSSVKLTLAWLVS